MWPLASALAAGALVACGGLARDPFPGTFRAAMLNDHHEHLFERPRGVDTPTLGGHVAAPAVLASLPPPAVAGAGVPPWEPERSARGKRMGERRARGVVAVAPSGPATQPAATPSLVDVAPVPPLPAEEPALRRAPEVYARWLRHGEEPARRRQRIAAFAASLVGARQIIANGKRFAANCSDFVRAVYSIESVDLYRWPGRPRGFGGVRSLYGLGRYGGGLHFRKLPEIGDLVFFHLTYDANRNQRIDDFLSHVGVVEKVDGDGTVHYVDHSSNRVRRGQLNLNRPGLWRDPVSLKRLNSPLRRRRKVDPAGTRYLAGELFAGFATLLR